MKEDDRRQCKVLAFLLEYPTASWRADFAEVRAVVEAMGDGKRRQLLRDFVDWAETTPIIGLQEIYTSAFDLDPATSLHLTYHLMGDGEDRGKALAGLLWIYHRAGYDAAIGELPDYLPMMLEFVALCPEAEDAALLRSCLGTVAGLSERLANARHPYARLLKLTAEIAAASESSQPG